jgi:hypothetical protein
MLTTRSLQPLGWLSQSSIQTKIDLVVAGAEETRNFNTLKDSGPSLRRPSQLLQPSASFSAAASPRIEWTGRIPGEHHA